MDTTSKIIVGFKSLKPRKKGNSYTLVVRKLEAAIEERLRLVAQLKLERTRLLDRESVLVDLVLQQENHLEHLGKVQAACSRPTASRDMALRNRVNVILADRTAEYVQLQCQQQIQQLQMQQQEQQRERQLQDWQHRSPRQQPLSYDNCIIPQLVALVQDVQKEGMNCCAQPAVKMSDSPLLMSPEQQQQNSQQFAELYQQRVWQVKQLQQQHMQQQLMQQQQQQQPGQALECQQQQQHAKTGTAAVAAHVSPFVAAVTVAASAIVAAAAAEKPDAGVTRGSTPILVGSDSLQSASGLTSSSPGCHNSPAPVAAAVVLAADAKAAETVPPAGCGQYCHTLLMSAAPEQWERAMSWTLYDWSQYLNNLVMRLCLLMELLGRLEATADDASSPACSAGGTADDGSGGTAEDASGSTTSGTASGSTAGGAVCGASGTTPDATAALCTPPPAPATATKQDTLREIDKAVDDFVIMVNLCLLFNPIPVRELSCHNNITGERLEGVPPAHWQQVNERLQLTAAQVSQLHVGYQQYCRALSNVQEKQQQLVHAIAASTNDCPQFSNTKGDSKLALSELHKQVIEAASPGLVAAAAAAAAELNGAAAGTVAVRISAAAAATATWKERSKLQGLLNRHMVCWTAASGLLLQFYCNTLTRLQIARMLIASYPSLPQVESLVSQLAKHPSVLAAGQQQALQQQQAHVIQQHHVQKLQQAQSQLAQQQQAFRRHQKELTSPLNQKGLTETAVQAQGGSGNLTLTEELC